MESIFKRLQARGGVYCSGDGDISVRRLELELSRLEPHEGGVGEVYRSKGLLAFTRAKEYIQILRGAAAGGAPQAPPG